MAAMGLVAPGREEAEAEKGKGSQKSCCNHSLRIPERGGDWKLALGYVLPNTAVPPLGEHREGP